MLCCGDQKRVVRFHCESICPRVYLSICLGHFGSCFHCKNKSICPSVYLSICLGNFSSWRVRRGPSLSTHFQAPTSVRSEASFDAMVMLLSFLHEVLLFPPSLWSLKLFWVSVILKRKLKMLSSISRSACHKFLSVTERFNEGTRQLYIKKTADKSHFQRSPFCH